MATAVAKSEEKETFRSAPPLAPGPALPRIDLSVVAIAVIWAITAAYYNSLNNGFQLDDQYGLVINPWIRSLHNIPRFFRDPFTLTVLRANADYRPLLQTTYALNYAISGYNTWSWHVLNLLLHASVMLSLFGLGRTLFGTGRVRPIPWLSERAGDLVAFTTAVLYAVHPITSGVGNYMWARSTLLVATFVVPATVFYLRAVRDQAGPRGILFPLLLYALGLFTKVEAISILGALYIAEILFPAEVEENRDSLLRRLTLTRSAWGRLLPFIGVTVVYVAIRLSVLPPGMNDAWGVLAIDRTTYFLTQFRAWWYYIGQLLAPVELVGDYGAYPASTSVLDPRVLYALAGWALALGLLLYVARRVPAVAFLGFCYFIHLSPHSSFMPLAEMVNDHRPYLPMAGVALLAVLGLYLLSWRISPKPWAFAAVVLVLAIPLVGLTHKANLMWVDGYSFWSDTVAKNPESSRAQMNYGIELMARGQMDEAESRFRETVRLAPFYAFGRINLGIALAARGNKAGAQEQYDIAVRVAPNDPAGYYWRGQFRRDQGDLNGAIEDFRSAVDRATVPARELQALADALIRSGRTQEAAAAINRGAALDPAMFQSLQQRLAGAGK